MAIDEPDQNAINKSECVAPSGGDSCVALHVARRRVWWLDYSVFASVRKWQLMKPINMCSQLVLVQCKRFKRCLCRFLRVGVVRACVSKCVSMFLVSPCVLCVGDVLCTRSYINESALKSEARAANKSNTQKKHDTNPETKS